MNIEEEAHSLWTPGEVCRPDSIESLDGTDSVSFYF